MSTLVLASGSPQRRAILSQLGIEFEVRVADVPERDTGAPEDVAIENARRKAAAVPSQAGELVLAADTVVALGASIYGKPRDENEARTTLQALSGARHAVVSGLCLLLGGETRVTCATTLVEFRKLDERLIDWYLATDEWRHRAGAYAIQGRGAALVRGIEGDYLNVVGLPVSTLLELAPQLLVPFPS